MLVSYYHHLKRPHYAELLTILFGNMLARRHKISKALELVASHGSTALNSQVLLEVRIEMFFEGEIANKSHTTDAAVEFHDLEDLSLGCFGEPKIVKRGMIRRLRKCYVVEFTYCMRDCGSEKEGHFGWPEPPFVVVSVAAAADA